MYDSSTIEVLLRLREFCRIQVYKNTNESN